MPYSGGCGLVWAPKVNYCVHKRPPLSDVMIDHSIANHHVPFLRDVQCNSTLVSGSPWPHNFQTEEKRKLLMEYEIVTQKV
jgi:hypothetical protein